MKKIIAFLLTLGILMGMSLPAIAETVTIPDTEGVYVSDENYYKMEDTLDTIPLTYEATVYLPEDYTEAAGVVFGNLFDVGVDIFVNANGVPRIIFKYPKTDGTTATWDRTFPLADIRTGGWAHMAIVYNPTAHTLFCYINGELIDSRYNQTFGEEANGYVFAPQSPFFIGKDNRLANNYDSDKYFAGKIRNVSMFSDMRTAEEVAADVAAVDTTDENILCHYNFDGMYNQRVEDSTVNNYDLYCPPVPETSISQDDGVSISAENYYSLTNVIENTPATLEATVYVPTTLTDRAGIVIGNFRDALTEPKVSAGKFRDCMNFEIHENGHPRLLIYYINSDGEYIVKDYIFSSVDVRTGTWAHIAFAYDAEKATLTCYLDGVARQTKTGVADLSYTLETAFLIGSDYRKETNWSPLYFNGKIRDVTLYSDMRTAEEIAQDAKKADVTDSNILCSYNFDGMYNQRVEDNTTNNNDLWCPPVPETSIGENEGVTTSEENYYSMTNIVENTPATIEATIYVPTTLTDRAGIVIGNFRDALTEAKVNAGKFRDCMNFEIHQNGVPRLLIYYINDDGEYITADYKFSNVDVRTGGWAHIALAYDAENATLTCYLNGVVAQTKTGVVDLSYTLETAFLVGADYRNETGWTPAYYFDGKIRTVSLFSDLRTADEIKSDYTNGAPLDDENLLADYNLDGKYATDVSDNSDNQNHLKNICTFFPQNQLEDYAYSFAVVGDTQTITYNYPDQLHYIYDFILDNKDSKKIAHVFGLGDITDRNTDEEWALAKEQISRLDGVVDYSMVRGNHDGTAKFNEYFGADSGSAYSAQYEEMFNTEQGINNTYRFFTVGDIDYLVLNLDYGAADVVLDWADKIIAAHPNHNVIINTHAYLTTDGTTLDENDTTTPTNAGYENNGETMWQKVFSKHSNVVMVLSGHIISDYIVMTQATGENGNTVSQFLVNPQGLDYRNGTEALGMVAMFYFSEDGKTVQVEYYSTVKQAYYLKENTFTFTMDKVDPRYGDVNDDADVNILDFIRLKKVLAKMDVKYNTRTADCNIDKTINVYDLTDLRKKLFGLAS